MALYASLIYTADLDWSQTDQSAELNEYVQFGAAWFLGNVQRKRLAYTAELEALITGVNLVAVLTGKGMADPARALLAKIEAALRAQGRTDPIRRAL